MLDTLPETRQSIIGRDDRRQPTTMKPTYRIVQTSMRTPEHSSQPMITAENKIAKMIGAPLVAIGVDFEPNKHKRIAGILYTPATGCVSCTAIADAQTGEVVHLQRPIILERGLSLTNA